MVEKWAAMPRQKRGSLEKLGLRDVMDSACLVEVMRWGWHTYSETTVLQQLDLLGSFKPLVSALSAFNKALFPFQEAVSTSREAFTACTSHTLGTVRGVVWNTMGLSITGKRHDVYNNNAVSIPFTLNLVS
jgi:hypothetical protein